MHGCCRRRRRRIRPNIMAGSVEPSPVVGILYLLVPCSLTPTSAGWLPFLSPRMRGCSRHVQHCSHGHVASGVVSHTVDHVDNKWGSTSCLCIAYMIKHHLENKKGVAATVCANDERVPFSSNANKKGMQPSSVAPTDTKNTNGRSFSLV